MQSVRLAVPRLNTPPPSYAGVAADGAVGQVGRAGIEHAAATFVASLPLKVQSVRLAVPELNTPVVASCR